MLYTLKVEELLCTVVLPPCRCDFIMTDYEKIYDFENLYKEILSGGRYDQLTETFGRRVPAIGFTIHFDALMEAINR